MENGQCDTLIHTLDMLLGKGVNMVAVFSPEHGFRGTASAGEHVSNSVDEKTGVPILSLYSDAGARPTDEAMESFDVLLIDIQDVGLRFYTYYITMVRLMNACADFGKRSSCWTGRIRTATMWTDLSWTCSTSRAWVICLFRWCTA